eukprot:scaffold1638_cov120-Cylindrotheca_fusiformis.AAC.11
MSSEFLSSMTFASGECGDIGCDCDECGAALPAPIRTAIRKRKRQRLETGPLRRTQDRSLVNREDGISVWKTTMPLDANPLVEFGQSHRVIWIERLNSDFREIRSIGEGIIGSSDEEKSRKALSWAEGEIYFLQSNGGKAVGWTHNRKSESSGKDVSTDPSGHAVLKTVKIPLSRMAEASESQSASTKEWTAVFLKLCRDALSNRKTDGSKKPEPYKFSSEDCAILKEAFRKAEPKQEEFHRSKADEPPLPIALENL